MIATTAFLFWYGQEPNRAWDAFTAVLIIACPCALVLTASFTYGFLLEIFSGNGFFVRSAGVLNRMTRLSHIAFDKTGTLSIPNENTVLYTGKPLPAAQLQLVRAVLAHSLHPLSRVVSAHLGTAKGLQLSAYKEVKGQGIMAYHDDVLIKAGSATFTGAQTTADLTGSRIYVSIDQEVYGYFSVENNLRKGIPGLIKGLGKYSLSLLSGDHDYTRREMEQVLGSGAGMHFQQSPEDKLAHIEKLQQAGERVMMVGDGLNDAGALRQSDVGVSVVDDKFAFSPACDAVLESARLHKLGSYLQMAVSARYVVSGIFIYSIIYNLIGLYFAVQGLLEPVIAAIIMPLSSISIIFIAYLSIKYIAARNL